MLETKLVHQLGTGKLVIPYSFHESFDLFGDLFGLPAREHIILFGTPIQMHESVLQFIVLTKQKVSEESL